MQDFQIENTVFSKKINTISKKFGLFQKIKTISKNFVPIQKILN